MKFQDDISNMNTYVRTYIRTSRNQYVPYFFKVGGIMKDLECSQDFSHYKSMGIFPDAQGQLTSQSLIRSG